VKHLSCFFERLPHLTAFRDFYGGCDASLNIVEFEKLILRVDDEGSSRSRSMTASASAATSSGQLIPVFCPESFPIQNAVFTQHLKAVAKVAADTASQAEARVTTATSAESESHELDDGDTVLPAPASNSLNSAPSPSFHDDAGDATVAAIASSAYDNFARNQNRFALDLAPTLLLSLGPVVASIIKSGVGKKYLEFKAVSAAYMLYGGSMLLLPASKGEIFSSQHLSLLDKRCLMKFFKAIGPVSDAGADAGSEKRLQKLDEALDGISLAEFMTRHGLDERLQAFVAFGMAGVARLRGTSAAEGVASIGAYLQSLGRYSDSSPFLYCCYGCGEMAQAFCRMAAVYGGIYVLRRSVSSIHVEDFAPNSSSCETGKLMVQDLSSVSSGVSMKKVKGVLLTDGQYVEAAHVVSSAECWPAPQDASAQVADDPDIDCNLRAVVISSKSIPLLPDLSPNIMGDPGAPILICIPPCAASSMSSITSCVRLLQLGSSCQVIIC
jgi:hypothetical protein